VHALIDAGERVVVLVPTSPYGSSKLMTEIMLRDAGAAHGLGYVILRYFNVAGADPLGRTGQSPQEPPISSRSRSKPRSG
jgi:UDP-glucose 4-epimerase